jgi:hypothetical protein
MNSFYFDLVKECLYMRGRAESVASGIDFDLRHNQRLHQWQLELAKKADDLADYYKWAEEYSGIAMFFYRFLRPVGELEELIVEKRHSFDNVPAARQSRAFVSADRIAHEVAKGFAK